MSGHDDKKFCSKPGCGNRHQAQNLCKKHYQMAYRNGEIVVIPGKGGKGRKHVSKRAYYGPGFHIGKTGYRKVRVVENGNIRWILEHRYVMEKRLGRKLFSDENVHHLNGDRQDNDDSNLELWVKGQPQGSRIEDALVWAKAIINRYG